MYYTFVVLTGIPTLKIQSAWVQLITHFQKRYVTHVLYIIKSQWTELNYTANQWLLYVCTVHVLVVRCVFHVLKYSIFSFFLVHQKNTIMCSQLQLTWHPVKTNTFRGHYSGYINREWVNPLIFYFPKYTHGVYLSLQSVSAIIQTFNASSSWCIWYKGRKSLAQ